MFSASACLLIASQSSAGKQAPCFLLVAVMRCTFLFRCTFINKKSQWGVYPIRRFLLTSAWGLGLRANIFFWCTEKKDRLQVVHLCFLFQIMGRKKKPDSEKSTKPGVSLDAECRDILSKIRQYEYEAERTDMAQAQAIRKCIRLAWDLHYAAKYLPFSESINLSLVAETPGNTAPQDSATSVVVTPETSDGGHLTRPTIRYPKGGRRRSTT